LVKRKFAARLFADWPAKVLSFAAALLLFFSYRLNRLEERYFSVPLELRVDRSLAVATSLSRSVRVTLRGESSGIFSIIEDDVTAVADLSSIRTPGSARVPVRIELGGSALDVSPLEISVDPPELALVLERRVSRLVPVTPSFKGYLATGYELANYSVIPAEVEVSGPAGAMAALADLGTDFIELAGRTEDFSARVRLLGREGLLTIEGPSEIEFRASVRPSLGQKTWEGLPIGLRGLDPGLAPASPLPGVSLVVRTSGAEGLDFEPGPETIYVDASGVRKPGTATLPVRAFLPEWVALESLDPESVVLTVVEARPAGQAAGEGGAQ
jgi:hypothetical protein